MDGVRLTASIVCRKTYFKGFSKNEHDADMFCKQYSLCKTATREAQLPDVNLSETFFGLMQFCECIHLCQLLWIVLCKKVTEVRQMRY